MSRTIWKYIVEPKSEIEMPIGAKILKVDNQNNEVCIWALVDPNAKKVKRTFVGIGTGHEVPNYELDYLGTTILHNGILVIHVFEQLEK